MFCLAAATGRLDMRGARGELVTAHGFEKFQRLGARWL